MEHRGCLKDWKVLTLQKLWSHLPIYAHSVMSYCSVDVEDSESECRNHQSAWMFRPHEQFIKGSRRRGRSLFNRFNLQRLYLTEAVLSSSWKRHLQFKARPLVQELRPPRSKALLHPPLCPSHRPWQHKKKTHFCQDFCNLFFLKSSKHCSGVYNYFQSGKLSVRMLCYINLDPALSLHWMLESMAHVDLVPRSWQQMFPDTCEEVQHTKGTKGIMRRCARFKIKLGFTYA